MVRVLLAAAVLQRRDAGNLLEAANEARRIVVADVHGNFLDGQFGFGQQLL